MYFVIYMYSVLLLFGTSTWPNSLTLPSQLGRPYVPELVRVSLNVPASLQCWPVTALLGVRPSGWESVYRWYLYAACQKSSHSCPALISVADNCRF